MLTKLVILLLTIVLSGCASFVAGDRDDVAYEKKLNHQIYISVSDFQGRSLSDLEKVDNVDEIESLKNYISKNYNPEMVMIGSNQPKDEMRLQLSYKQVSSSYKNTSRKLWLAITGLSLGLIPYHSQVIIYLDALVIDKNGKEVGRYQKHLEYDFWVHLFLTPYSLSKNSKEHGRNALRNRLFDQVVLNAHKDNLL